MGTIKRLRYTAGVSSYSPSVDSNDLYIHPNITTTKLQAEKEHPRNCVAAKKSYLLLSWMLIKKWFIRGGTLRLELVAFRLYINGPV